MADTATPLDTQAYLAALDAALSASNAPEQRAKRERLAALSREAEELSASITATDLAVTRAEQALHKHLNAKHGHQAGPIGEATQEDVLTPPKRRELLVEHHAANCAIAFGDPCDCQ